MPTHILSLWFPHSWGASPCLPDSHIYSKTLLTSNSDFAVFFEESHIRVFSSGVCLLLLASSNWLTSDWLQNHPFSLKYASWYLSLMFLADLFRLYWAIESLQICLVRTALTEQYLISAKFIAKLLIFYGKEFKQPLICENIQLI